VRLSWFFSDTSADSEAWERLRVFSGGGWTFCLIERLRWKRRKQRKAEWHQTRSGRDQNIFRVDAELRGLCKAVFRERRSC